MERVWKPVRVAVNVMMILAGQTAAQAQAGAELNRAGPAVGEKAWGESRGRGVPGATAWQDSGSCATAEAAGDT